MRNGRRKPGKSSTPASRRPGTMGLMSLLDEETETPDTRAEAFVGRMMRTNNGEAWSLLAVPYCKDTGGYSLMGRAIKNMHKRYVSGVGWTEERFFRILAWIMEAKRQIDSYEFDKTARQYDAGRLPLGVLSNLEVETYEKITNSKVNG